MQNQSVVWKIQRERDFHLRLVDRSSDDLLHSAVESPGEAGIADPDVEESLIPQIEAVDIFFDPVLVGRRRLVRPVAEILAINHAGIAPVAAVEWELRKPASLQFAPRFADRHLACFRSFEVCSCYRNTVSSGLKKGAARPT